MKKFPVISEKGNEYMVGINNPFFDYYAVSLYVKKKILGITYNSLINKDSFGDVPWYDGSIYEHDFIRMAKEAVERYETEMADVSRQNMLRDLGASKFAEWDGNCSDK